MTKYIIEEAPNYFITDSCEVFNSTTGHKMKPTISGSGYPIVRLRYNGYYVNLTMHRLVAKYLCKIQAPIIEHKDDDKTNYQPNNLIGSNQTNNITKALGVPVIAIAGNVQITFESAAAGARFIGVCSNRITACCKHKVGYKTAGGYRWEYVNVSEACAGH